LPFRGGKGVLTLLSSKGPSQLCIIVFYCYIIVLLINTNLMIYILCIKQGRARLSVLAARAGKLSMQGDELMLSETANGGAGACMGGLLQLAGSGFLRGPW
jgi:hypothetical protein